MNITAERASSLIEKFSSCRVVVLGDVVLDRYITGVVERINPEAPVPILLGKTQSFATGGAGNTAKNVASLGGKATLIGVIGSDSSGEDVKIAAQREGYAPVLITDSARPTSEKKRYLVRGQQMLRVDFEEISDIAGEVQAQVIAALTEHVAQADLVIVSDYAKGVITKAVVDHLMQLLQKKNIPLMADVKPAHISWFKGATYISPNKKEAYAYLGLNEHENSKMTAADLASRIQKEFQAGVFLTLSAEGIFVLNGEDGTHVPQRHKIEIADTSGCGDTAAVTVALAKYAGATDIEAAQLGNAAGAVNATKVGAQGITPAELLHMAVHDEVLHEHP